MWAHSCLAGAIIAATLVDTFRYMRGPGWNKAAGDTTHKTHCGVMKVRAARETPLPRRLLALSALARSRLYPYIIIYVCKRVEIYSARPTWGNCIG